MLFGTSASSIQPAGSCDFPTFVDVAETYQTSGTSLTVNKPTGTVEGDLMVAIINWNGNVTITAPSGWTVIDEDDGMSTAATVLIYYRIAGASEPSSYSWTSSNGRGGVGLSSRLPGVSTLTPLTGRFPISTNLCRLIRT